MRKAILQTKRQNLIHRNGEVIEIYKKLPRDDFDTENLYKVKLADGTKTIISEKEFKETI